MKQLYEFWMRLAYLSDVMNSSFTAVIRPDDRSEGPKKIVLNEIALVRFLEEPGNETLNLPPKFSKQRRLVQIRGINVTPIKFLNKELLRKCSPDCQTREQVKYHLALIYNREFSDDDVVTVIHWRYMDRAILDLIMQHVLQIGTAAADNPFVLPVGRFAAGVADKDYPAQTPKLWNRTYEALGLTERNVRLYGDPESAAGIFTAFKSDPKYIGGDVGVGFKDKVLDLLDRVDPLASKMGAVNVVVKEDGNLVGYNTDGVGYTRSLEAKFQEQGKELAGQTVAILGAGATANAIAFALADAGAKLIILNRTESKADELAARINETYDSRPASSMPLRAKREAFLEADAIVTVIDAKGSDLERFSALGDITLPATDENVEANHVDAKDVMKILKPWTIISDVMLRDNDTATIALAKEVDFPTLDGIPMVQNQAVEAFWLVNKTALEEKKLTKAAVEKAMLG